MPIIYHSKYHNTEIKDTQDSKVQYVFSFLRIIGLQYLPVSINNSLFQQQVSSFNVHLNQHHILTTSEITDLIR